MIPSAEKPFEVRPKISLNYGILNRFSCGSMKNVALAASVAYAHELAVLAEQAAL